MNRQFLKSSFLVGGISAISALAELFKDAVVAAFLGVTGSGDAFFVALTFPLIITGAVFQSFQISFVPLLSSAIAQKGKAEADRMINSLILVIGPVFVILALGAYWAAPVLTSFIGAGLTPQMYQLSIQLCRILALSILFSGFTGLLMNWLNSNRYFAAPASINLVRSTGMVITILLLWGHLGIFSVAVGFAVGTLAQLCVVGVSAFHRGLRLHWIRLQNWTEIKHMLVVMFWPFIMIVIRQSNTVFERFFASYLSEGNISALTYSFRLVLGVVAVFSVSAFTVSLPTASQDASVGNHQSVRDGLSAALKLVLLLALPVATVMIVLGPEIIAIVYKRGAFDVAATQMTAQLFSLYAPSLVLRAIVPLLQMPLFAYGRVKTPVIISLATYIFQIILNAILVRWLGSAALVLGDGIARFAELLITIYFLHSVLNPILPKSFKKFALKIVAAAVTMLALLLLGRELMHLIPFTSHLGALGSFFLVGLFGGTGFLLALWLLRVPELELFTSGVADRLNLTTFGQSRIKE